MAKKQDDPQSGLLRWLDAEQPVKKWCKQATYSLKKFNIVANYEVHYRTPVTVGLSIVMLKDGELMASFYRIHSTIEVGIGYCEKHAQLLTNALNRGDASSR